MRLSRVNTHKYKKKQTITLSFIKNDSHHVLKKVILTSAITGAALFSTSMAFADGGLSEYIKRWYEERVTEVEEHLTSSIEAEATNQKALLLKQVREQTELSIQEIQDYAASKQSTIKSNIETKANEAIDAIASDIETDVEMTKKLIDGVTVGEITESVPDQVENPVNKPVDNNRSIEEKDQDKSNPIVLNPVDRK